jgi:CheY-like chemotaxis protein
MTSLMTGLARDLNTQLGPVIGHAQMLQRHRIGIAEMAHVNAIERCAQNARRLVESFLAFAKPAAPMPRACDVNAVVRDACSIVEPQLKASGIDLVLDLDPDVPSTLADERQLARAFGNAARCLDEACGFLAGEESVLRVTTECTGGMISVTFAGTGEGSATEDLGDTAESSVGAPEERFGGTWLAVARTIVQNHGGSISVEGRPGGGAIRIELPVRRPSEGEAGPARQRAQAPVQPLRVLVVEHDEEMRSLMKKLLASAGHRAVICARADAVFQALESLTFDAVVAELSMPGLNGFDLHARLAAQRPELASRIVFTSAEACDTRTSAFIHNARCRLLPTPFDVRALLAAIVETAGQ